MALQQILGQKDESDCYERNHAVLCPPACKYKFPQKLRNPKNDLELTAVV